MRYKAMKALTANAIASIIALVSLQMTGVRAQGIVEYPFLISQGTQNSADKIRVEGYELSNGSIYLGIPIQEAVKKLESEGYFLLSSRENKVSHAAVVDGKSVAFVSKYLKEYIYTKGTVSGTKETSSDKYFLFATAYRPRVFMAMRKITYSDDLKMPLDADVTRMIVEKYGPVTRHNGNTCRAYSDTKKVDPGKCWFDFLKDGNQELNEMLSRGVSYYVLNNLDLDKKRSERVVWVQSVLYSPKIEKEDIDESNMMWSRISQQLINRYRIENPPKTPDKLKF